VGDTVANDDTEGYHAAESTELKRISFTQELGIDYVQSPLSNLNPNVSDCHWQRGMNVPI